VVDRLKLILGARWLPSWRRVIVLVQPETVLRWHLAGFQRFWRRRSRPRTMSPLPRETVDLIGDMAAHGRLWGAERIRGELLFVNMHATSTKAGRIRGWASAYPCLPRPLLIRPSRSWSRACSVDFTPTIAGPHDVKRLTWMTSVAKTVSFEA